MRIPLIAGNWKMHKTSREASELARQLRDKIDSGNGAEVVVCPPFTALETVARALQGSGIGLGAQDIYWEEQGAFTGEISPLMLREVGCSWVIVGHSERRQLLGETDAGVNKKVKAALSHGLRPMICVGETGAEREADQTKQKVKGQVEAALEGLDTSMLSHLVIAYEPIWAIGTGLTASAGDAQEVIAFIRETVQETTGRGQDIRILYGGSVKPENISELMKQTDIDGALVGGASLEADSFAAIARFTQS